MQVQIMNVGDEILEIVSDDRRSVRLAPGKKITVRGQKIELRPDSSKSNSTEKA